jgi:hypothetical protein
MQQQTAHATILLISSLLHISCTHTHTLAEASVDVHAVRTAGAFTIPVKRAAACERLLDLPRARVKHATRMAMMEIGELRRVANKYK